MSVKNSPPLTVTDDGFTFFPVFSLLFDHSLLSLLPLSQSFRVVNKCCRRHHALGVTSILSHHSLSFKLPILPLVKHDHTHTHTVAASDRLNT